MVMYGCESWTVKKAERQRIDAFELLLEKPLESPLDCKETLLCIRPGVWHHAAFTPDKRNLNVMIVLPERAYMTDCHVAEIPAKKQLEIKL